MKPNEMASIRAFILDMDGVLWRGDEPIGNLPEIFTEIKTLGCSVLLATNNSTRSVKQYQEKLNHFGVSLDAWQFINSSEAAARYLKKRFPEGGPVFIVGEEGLFNALEREGFYDSEQGAQVVVAGMDRQLTFDRLKRASLLIRSGVPFVGTNPDRTFPTPEGLIPGSGTVLAAIEAATDVKPFIVGKPAPGMYQVALERLGTHPEQTLAVGDRLETDIAGGQAAGCRTALVLTGASTRQQAEAWQPAPDFITADLAHLLKEFSRVLD
jgi:4-nitrophenyl phosphatase